MKRLLLNLLCGIALALALAACTATPVPTTPDPVPPGPDGRHNASLRIAVLDYQLLGDLSDPEVMAKYTRADILITQPQQFWGHAGADQRMATLRAANPTVKIIGYFRSKCIREEWATVTREDNAYIYDLYHAALPYLSYTTHADTVQDWPGVAVFDYLDPAARDAMLDIFESYQRSSPAKLDGVFWDYFSPSLWISPDVDTMAGDPDFDHDGVPHAQDLDEQQAFRDGQDAWVHEMRARMGDRFIQIANGARALHDSTFAGLFDGMLYEIFPNVGFVGQTPYRDALDPSVPWNLWAAQRWLRTQNGGPWQILENPWIPYMVDQNQTMRPVNLGDVNRSLALLTGATVVHYNMSGQHLAGVPDPEIDLGTPLGGATVAGNVYTRAFENGSVTLNMGSGAYPMGFSFSIRDGNQDVVQAMSVGYIYP